MRESNGMNTRDLLEFASLDVLGLLDDTEREAFERALRAAPPSLQAQVRREQLRLANDDTLLPDIEAPVGLKARVLAKVLHAMQGVAPIRTLTPASLAPSRGVSPMWRAGAIGALAACLVFGFTYFDMSSQYSRLRGMLAETAISEAFLSNFGPRMEASLYNADSKLVHFSSGEGEGEAVIILNTRTMTGEILCRDLPKTSGDYRLVLVDGTGNEVGEVILKFETSEANRVVESIQIPAQAGSGLRLQLVPPDDAESATVLESSTSL